MSRRTLDFKMVSEVVKKCVNKGFLLDREMLEFLENLGIPKTEKIIDKLYNLNIKQKILSKKIFDDYKSHFLELSGESVGEKKESEGVVVKSNTKKISKKISLSDFVGHFTSRYNIIKDILEKRNIENLASIRRVGSGNGSYSIIAAVVKKRITKNKNLLIEVEDLTGNIIILVNKENKKLFSEGKNLMLDDIVCFRASGSNKMLFCNEIIFPDSKIEKEKYSKFDEYVAFSGDLHVGSKMFLEESFLKFVAWMNGDIGDARQKAISKKVKYLFLTGDTIDGSNVYQGQDKYLDIKSSREQYKKLAILLDKIRKDISIIICPGQHDSVWVGERQPAISKKWAPDLYAMENVYLVTNPAVISIREFEILMYHGASINRFIDEMPMIRIRFGHDKPLEIVKEILKRRHLAPTHGLMDYIPEEEDSMVIKEIPDIFVVGDQHRVGIDTYNKILLVSGSCWQNKTPFEEKVGNNPDPCKVPLFNLKTRETKIMDFSSREIKWEKDENLSCEVDGKR